MRGTLSDQFRDKHPFFWVVVFAAVLSLCYWSFVASMLYKYGGLASDGFGWDTELRVTDVYAGGPAEGKLQVGDVIRTINGMPATPDDLFQTIYFNPPGTSYTLEIERNGNRQRVELVLTLHPSPNATYTWEGATVFSLLGLSFLSVALLAGLLRPADSTVRLLFVAFFIVSLSTPVFGTIAMLFNETESLIDRFFRLFGGIFLAGPAMFHLFLRFPPGLSTSKFLQRLNKVFYTAGITSHALATASSWGLIQVPRGVFRTIQIALALTVMPAIVLVIIRNYRLAHDAQQRHRIKWIIKSAVIAVSFFAIYFLFEALIRSRIYDKVPEAIYTGIFYLSQLLMLSIPAAWGYAILKHRVLDINVVIRRSLRYLLASRGFILIEALLAFALLSFIFAGRIGAALDRLGSNTRTLVTILGTVLMVLGLQTVNRKIRPLIDRRFFREAYDAQQILTELTSSLRATTNVNQVLELTTAKIQQALYAANVTIFLRNGQHDFRSAVSRDYHEREKLSQSVTRELHLPDEAFVVQRVNDSSQPAEIDWDDPYSPVATQLAAMANGNLAAQQEFDTLRALQTNLVLPLAAKDELLGVLALGPRAGDLPYSREDKRMLMNVAGQTAMALENSRLIEQKIDLEAENERRAQELEEARQLQLSMLPKKVPQLPHLDIAAFMKTATEVGGDYYDFHVADDGTLTIAIGDATGHGLKAGTMVTATKSLFNETTGTESPAALLQRCSRALKRMNLRGLFMALTVAEVRDNRLTFAAAGMPALLVYCAATQQVEELLHKAMPLGAVTKFAYQEQELTLAPGDVVVLLSDGLPERFNAANEMLGYEAMPAILQATAHLPATEIIQQFVQRGEDWAQGQAQDDDVTFVVLKVK